MGRLDLDYFIRMVKLESNFMGLHPMAMTPLPRSRPSLEKEKSQVQDVLLKIAPRKRRFVEEDENSPIRSIELEKE